MKPRLVRSELETPTTRIVRRDGVIFQESIPQRKREQPVLPVNVQSARSILQSNPKVLKRLEACVTAWHESAQARADFLERIESLPDQIADLNAQSRTASKERRRAIRDEIADLEFEIEDQDVCVRALEQQMRDALKPIGELLTQYIAGQEEENKAFNQRVKKIDAEIRRLQEEKADILKPRFMLNQRAINEIRGLALAFSLALPE